MRARCLSKAEAIEYEARDRALCLLAMDMGFRETLALRVKDAEQVAQIGKEAKEAPARWIEEMRAKGYVNSKARLFPLSRKVAWEIVRPFFVRALCPPRK
jgi:hypothetical protein